MMGKHVIVITVCVTISRGNKRWITEKRFTGINQVPIAVNYVDLRGSVALHMSPGYR